MKYINLRKTMNLVTENKRYYADSKRISERKYWELFDSRTSYSCGRLVFGKHHRRSYCVIGIGNARIGWKSSTEGEVV